MILQYSSYETEFTVKVSVNFLEIEGTRFGEYKLLKFSPNNPCLAKFRFKTVDAVILKITLSKVFLYLPKQEKSKTMTINDFIACNASTETIIRLEKDGIGPYRNNERSTELVKMLLSHKEKHEKKEEFHQPTPQEEFDIFIMPKSFKYGFRNYQQLYSWFTLPEIQLIVREGFSIVTLQKGRDYVDSMHTMKQVLVTNSLEDITEVNCGRRY